MMDVCAKLGDVGRSEYWHETMVLAGVKPNAHSFSIIINACGQAGDVVAAGRWMTKMSEAGIPPNIITYNSVMNACGKALDTESALRVLEHMKAHGVKPDIVTYTSLALPFARRGSWLQVERISKEVALEGLELDSHFVTTCLRGYTNASPRQTARSEELYLSITRRSVHRNVYVLSALKHAVGNVRCKQLMTMVGAEGARIEDLEFD